MIGESVVIRINYCDLIKIEKIFKPYKHESVASYFHRLAKELKGGNIIL